MLRKELSSPSGEGRKKFFRAMISREKKRSMRVHSFFRYAAKRRGEKTPYSTDLVHKEGGEGGKKRKGSYSLLPKVQGEKKERKTFSQ